VTLEPHAGDPLVAIDGQLDGQLIAAEWVQIVVLQIDALKFGRRRTPVVGSLVVLEDVLAVKLFHRREGGAELGWRGSLVSPIRAA
jgi:hypothetical protein